jgi:hypothetical protein
MTKKFDNNGRLSMWKRTSGKGTEFLSGQVEIDGVEYDVVLFNNGNAKHPKAPSMTGTVKIKEGFKKPDKTDDVSFDDSDDPFDF